MRVALASTLSTPVAASRVGSIEGLVWTLADELTRAGHEVTTFAALGSEAPGEVVETLPPYGDSALDWQAAEWVNLCRLVERAADFDVVHSHAYLWGLPLGRLSPAPIVHTLHVWPWAEAAALVEE